MFRLSYECSYNLSWSREATPRNWTCLHEQHNRGYGSRFLDIVMKLDRKALERGYWSWRGIKSVSENVGRRKDIVAEGKEGIDHKRSRRKKHCLYSPSTPFMSKYARIRGRYYQRSHRDRCFRKLYFHARHFNVSFILYAKWWIEEWNSLRNRGLVFIGNYDLCGETWLLLVASNVESCYFVLMLEIF